MIAVDVWVEERMEVGRSGGEDNRDEGKEEARWDGANVAQGASAVGTVYYRRLLELEL